jgi:radical SAM protein with 4Fe4S-binding SPASM domain
VHDIIFIRDVDTFGGQVEDRRLESQLPKIKRIPCIQLWRDFAISWDGMATVCCKDVLYKLVVGNIFESSIAEIWKNKHCEAIRQIHKTEKWDEIPLCRNCNEWNQ